MTAQTKLGTLATENGWSPLPVVGRAGIWVRWGRPGETVFVHLAETGRVLEADRVQRDPETTRMTNAGSLYGRHHNKRDTVASWLIAEPLPTA